MRLRNPKDELQVTTVILRAARERQEKLAARIDAIRVEARAMAEVAIVNPSPSERLGALVTVLAARVAELELQLEEARETAVAGFGDGNGI